MRYGVAQTVYYTAINNITMLGQTGDAANHSLSWSKDDGTSTATTNSPSEVGNGKYKVMLTALECQTWSGMLSGTSSTSNVAIIPRSFDAARLPDADAGSNGGLPTVDASNQIAGVSGNVAGSVASVIGNVGGSIAGSVASVAGNVGGSVASVTAPVTVTGKPAVSLDWSADVTNKPTIGTSTLTTSDIDARLAAYDVSTATNVTTAVATIEAYGDANWTSATLDAADIRSAIGMASANLDTQLASIKTDTGTTLPGTLLSLQSHGDSTWATATGFSTLTAQQVWEYAARSLTDKAGFSISGTIATLDALNTSLSSTHGSGAWSTAVGFATSVQATTILSQVEAIQGTGFDPATDSLANICSGLESIQLTEQDKQDIANLVTEDVLAGIGSASIVVNVTPLQATVTSGIVSRRNLTAYQHSRASFTFSLTDGEGTPLDLSGKTCVFVMFTAQDQSTAFLTVTNCVVGGTGHDNVTVSLTEDDTATAGSFYGRLVNVSDRQELVRVNLDIVAGPNYSVSSSG